MPLKCHEEGHTAGANLVSDVKSFTLQHSSSFAAILTSSESDALGSQPGISLSSTLPVTASSTSGANLHQSQSPPKCSASGLHCSPFVSNRRQRPGWQSQEVSISTFVRRYPQCQALQHDCNADANSETLWKDLPQIETMVRAGCSRPPVCQPEDLTVGKLLGCGGQAQVRLHCPLSHCSPFQA